MYLKQLKTNEGYLKDLYKKVSYKFGDILQQKQPQSGIITDHPFGRISKDHRHFAPPEIKVEVEKKKLVK